MRTWMNANLPIDEWTADERDELAVPEHDPGYLPIDMQPSETWRPSRMTDADTLVVEMREQSPATET